MTNSAERPHDIVLILTDQQRDGGPFEPEGMGLFRSQQLKGFNRLCERGVRFTQHRITSSACAPSRASLFTGYSPWVHGVTQTDGFAKQHDDPAQSWLLPNQVPTLGHRFQAAGWESVYVGKWHLSHADLEVNRSESADETSERYRAANVLSPYGFDQWVGPEPHGADLGNTGVFRDRGYVEQAQAFLRARAGQEDRPPFLLVVSLVNPHDICFWPAWSLWKRGLLDTDDIEALGTGETDALVSHHEPSALRAYRERYYGAYGPKSIVQWLYRRHPEQYRKFYCSLLRRADRHIDSLLNTLDETGLHERTHVVCTSDHGELLGAHGALHQKWYNAFEETVRVPLVIASAKSERAAGTTTTALTSHQDMVPTLLGLAGIDERMPDTHAGDFDSRPPLLGRDIMTSKSETQSYFVTHDDILSGQTPEAAFGRRFPLLGALLPMRYPDLGVENHAVEALVVRMDPGQGQPPGLWKLVRYFNPIRPEETESDEWMLFDLKTDPVEAHNLARDESVKSLKLALEAKLTEERVRVRQNDNEV